MAEWEPCTGVVHRTDGNLDTVAQDFADNLASLSYYRVIFRKPPTHSESVVSVFALKTDLGYQLATQFDQYDVARSGCREVRRLTNAWTIIDTVPFKKLSEALMAAKIEATLHHAHTRRFTCPSDT